MTTKRFRCFRQKQTIEQMHQHISAIEDRLNQNSFIVMSQRVDEDKLSLRLKDAQLQISQLKAQMQQSIAVKQEEIETLQKKLG